MILSAQSVRTRAALGLISPFHEQTRSNGLTYGLGPHGYDVRVAEDLFLWPGQFKLASTIERFNMPHDLVGRVQDKSTWARRGISLLNTVIEAGWTGYLTLEISNLLRGMVQIVGGSPIAQIMFEMLDYPTDLPYCGKYQNQQPGATAAILAND